MDNFIDKLAQKFIAGEVIKANSVAEERELKRLREQVAEYERCLQEMRKVQMTNTQTAQNLHDMMVESTENFQKLTRQSIAKIEEIQGNADVKESEAKETIETAKEAMGRLEEQAKAMLETVEQLTSDMDQKQQEIGQWFQKADDFLHKENVKVYRNVQAVVVEEVGNKTESILKAQEENGKKYSRPVLVFAILTFLVAAADLVLQIFNMLGIRLI